MPKESLSQRLEFPDNRLALSLFGELDDHLKLMEVRLGVVLHPLGNVVVISPLLDAGAKDAGAGLQQVGKARLLLESLYSGLERGQHVDRSLVEAAIRALDEVDMVVDKRTDYPASENAVGSRSGRATRRSENGAKKIQGTALDRVLADDALLQTPRRTIYPRSQQQAAYIKVLATSDMIFAIGPAGTGKTYLAVAAAVNAFLEGQAARIVLTRPAVEAGERLGFLPGDLQAKVDPYLRPLYDALYDMLGFEKVERMTVRGELEIAPLAFMRGRTLEEAFIILDEAQNTTSEQMKMFLTRLGERSRAVICGDVTQVDLPRGRVSGLVEAQRLLNGLSEIAFIQFDFRDVVRHALVQKIVCAYEQAADRSLAHSTATINRSGEG